MSVGPIPRSAIRAYAAEYGIEGDRFDYFNRIIRSTDNEYLSLITPKDRDNKPIADSVSVDDTEGMKRLFKRLKTRQQNATTKPRKH